MKRFVIGAACAALLMSSCGDSDSDGSAADEVTAPSSTVAPATSAATTSVVPTTEAIAASGESELLVEGLEGRPGTAVGPEGALYVTDGVAGSILRVDLDTGEQTTVASDLPEPAVPIGGVVDVAFADGTPYALVSMAAGEDGAMTAGIYRIDGADSVVLVADVGRFSAENPPSMEVAVDVGVQYSMVALEGGFLVTDGHHNRVHPCSST